MIVLEADKLPSTKRPDGVVMTDFFKAGMAADGSPAGQGVQMGLGVFPPGMIAPPAIHQEDEYGFVIAGTIKAKIGGKVFEAGAGSATFIPAGEEHISFNDSSGECRVVWALVKCT
ncbi:hypothetical protein AGMMS49944_03120 [Spirochaetia bacterium]|nr:hypothetical protein AGMMS49944_03120 [Spirochaetia bacterium]